jgi:hypothetical protein
MWRWGGILFETNPGKKLGMILHVCNPREAYVGGVSKSITVQASSSKKNKK